MTAPTPGHSYCTHDEGEPCDCSTALSPATAPDERVATVRALTDQGLSAPQIAKRLGMSKRTVERLRGRST
jgi:DNA-binding NarL/FixJ family response regulator